MCHRWGMMQRPCQTGGKETKLATAQELGGNARKSRTQNREKILHTAGKSSYGEDPKKQRRVERYRKQFRTQGAPLKNSRAAPPPSSHRDCRQPLTLFMLKAFFQHRLTELCHAQRVFLRRNQEKEMSKVRVLVGTRKG